LRLARLTSVLRPMTQTNQPIATTSSTWMATDRNFGSLTIELLAAGRPWVTALIAMPFERRAPEDHLRRPWKIHASADWRGILQAALAPQGILAAGNLQIGVLADIALEDLAIIADA